MQLFKDLADSFIRHRYRNAFYIQETYHTYETLSDRISGIRNSLQLLGENTGSNIGLIINDDIETYAAIIAIWLEGKAYVPISPASPENRNKNMIAQAGVTTMISSSEHQSFPECQIIYSKMTQATKTELLPVLTPGTSLAYILFTSGTTGTPKGVPITRDNLTAFVRAFEKMDMDLDESDRWLQMFELTFDLSIMSYLIPLLKGACIYTIPKNKIKYSYVAGLLDEHRLTVALMIPSIIQYLQPYFDEINCPDLKYNLFCGEALPLHLTEKWSRCIPTASILNVYGPSEATIFCTAFTFHRNAPNSVQNGIMSIGKPMTQTQILLTDPEDPQKVITQKGAIGELCLAGTQLTPGYLNDEKKNKTSFFIVEQGGQMRRFYRTGDLCLLDPNENILFIGRLDSQVKVQGYRVELSEIEFHAKTWLKDLNLVALPYTNPSHNQDIALIIESEAFDSKDLIAYLKTKTPFYMIPSRILFEKTFPYNSNGKIDRKNLLNMLKSL